MEKKVKLIFIYNTVIKNSRDIENIIYFFLKNSSRVVWILLAFSLYGVNIFSLTFSISSFLNLVSFEHFTLYIVHIVKYLQGFIYCKVLPASLFHLFHQNHFPHLCQ